MLYRLIYSRQSFVLKCFAHPMQASEVSSYALLAQLDVPTLPVYGRTAHALLLEDLTTSAAWRLATPDDMQRPEVDGAVAVWYRALHEAGQTWLSNSIDVPIWLQREDERLDAAAILQIGAQLQLGIHPVWQLAAEHIEALKQAIRSNPTTLIYNDFHWTNLALSRQAPPNLHAIVFDYHLLGIGMRYSDYRNVSGAFGALAQAAFQAMYGPTDEREAVLDAPVAVLVALQSGLAWPQLPGWALELAQEATSGRLEAKLQRAISLL
jgi:hypothetical protein